MSNKQDKGGKKPYSQGGGGFNNGSGNGSNQGSGSYNNQPYKGYQGGRPANNYQKKEEGGNNQVDEGQGLQRNVGNPRQGTGNYKDEPNSTTRKKGLGKNKFIQIYNEYSHNRKNGIELNQDWLKSLYTQFPQIFVREHLTPIFMDKSYCESFNVAEAFEKIVKKAPVDAPSNSISQATKEPPAFTNAQKQQPVENQNQSDSDEDPNWEIDEMNFDFTFKTFDKERYAKEMKDKSFRPNNQTQQRAISQSGPQRKQPEQAPNALDSFLQQQQNPTSQGDELSRFIASISTSTGGGGDMLSGLLGQGLNSNTQQQQQQQQQQKQDLEFDEEYDDIDMKLERLARENEQKKEFERQLLKYEEEQKDQGIVDAEEDDDEKDLEAFGETEVKPKDNASTQQARQINLQTVIVDDFQDEDEEEEDDDNDETFNTKDDEPYLPQQQKQNQYLQGQQQKQEQENQSNIPKASFLQSLRDNTQRVEEFKSNDSNPIGFKNQLQAFDFGQQSNNQNGGQKQNNALAGFGFGSDKLGFENQFLKIANQNDSFATFGFGQNSQKDNNPYLNDNIQHDDEDEDDEEDDNFDQRKNQDESYEEKGQLEELIVNSDDVDDIKQKVYEALFQTTSDQERKEQEGKKREKERKEREKIAELMSYQEEEKNNYFQAVAYILQANPQEAIWIYKDIKGIKQGPYNSIMMDSWRDHFSNTEVSHNRHIYWIKYKDLTLYTKLYANRVKDLIQQQEQARVDPVQPVQPVYNASNQGQQQKVDSTASSNNPEMNPQIQMQLYNLQMQFMQQNPQGFTGTSQQQQQQMQAFSNLISQNPQLSTFYQNLRNQVQYQQQLQLQQQQQQQQQQILQQQQQQQQNINQQLLFLNKMIQPQQQQYPQQMQPQQQSKQGNFAGQAFPQQYQNEQFFNQKFIQQFMQTQPQQQQQGFAQNDQNQHHMNKKQQSKQQPNMNNNANRNNFNMIDQSNMNINSQQNHRKNNSINVNQNQNYKGGNQMYQNNMYNPAQANNNGNTNSGYRTDYQRNPNQSGYNNNDYNNNRQNAINSSNNAGNNNNQMYNHRNQQGKHHNNNDNYQKNPQQNRGGSKPYINDQDFPSLS